MTRTDYTKPPLTYEQQLDQLEKRGLKINDREKALHLLVNISYYRLSGYWYPLLLDKSNHTFKPNAEFEIAFKLYCFDRKLRQLLVGELEKIEVAIRSKMIYVLAHKHGAFWFQKQELFKNVGKHTTSMSKIFEEYSRSDEEFIASFKRKYLEQIPPSWITFEIISFGTLSKLYQNLSPGIEKREVAHYFGLSDSVFENWIHSIVYLRNVCAHHTRLWNRSMSISPQFPRNPHKQWLENKNVRNDRVYFILSMVAYLLQTVNPGSTFQKRIKLLFDEYENVDLRSMGFPENWQNELLWK